MLGLPVAIKTNVEYTQAAGCYLCLHVGSVAVFFGRRRPQGGPRRRLELFTPLHKFRYSSGQKRKRAIES